MSQTRNFPTMKHIQHIFLLILSVSLIHVPGKTAIRPRQKSEKNGYTKKGYMSVDQNPYFNIPVTYNSKVKYWLKRFQGSQKRSFSIWMKRATQHLPEMKKIFRNQKLPTDLAYIAIIESGLSASATSHAQAVGYWQFIQSTGNRYGLKTKWWLDERRDFRKSTLAAAEYLADLYKMFGSWYLTAAAYNMGENRLKRLIRKYKTRNYWTLSNKKGFPKETRQYIPKLLATVLIAKVPRLYGFTNTEKLAPLQYDFFYLPGGTDLANLAKFIGFTKSHLSKLNPALIQGFIPKEEKGYWIRIPKGHSPNVTRFMRQKLM